MKCGKCPDTKVACAVCEDDIEPVCVDEGEDMRCGYCEKQVCDGCLYIGEAKYEGRTCETCGKNHENDERDERKEIERVRHR